MSNDTNVMIREGVGRLRYPVPGYAVVHERGTVVFDTGLHQPLMASNDELGDLAGVFTVELTPADLIEQRLAEHGIDPASVTHVVNSHLHFDHCGRNGPFAHASTVVQRSEWEVANDPPPLSYVGVPLDEVGAGHLNLIDGTHDVFADGSVVCVPTPGHTVGHQSLLVTSPTESVLLVGDACYFRSMLTGKVTPTFAVDAETQLRSYGVLDDYERRGTRLVFSHDVDEWDAIPASLA
jgi:N-acyl homoserine lactone hydrolase